MTSGSASSTSSSASTSCARGSTCPEVTLVAILDADKEGFLRSSWSLIQMIGRAARNIGGKVVMYADRSTESMAAAIDETNRRRGIQEAYNRENGIEPTTIVKEIHDLNERLRYVAESTVVYTSERQELAGRALTLENTAAIEKLVARMETEMRSAARELDFERAAALRDEVQAIRLRVLEQDESIVVGRAAERAASTRSAGPRRRRGSEAHGPGRRGTRRAAGVRGDERHGAAGGGGAVGHARRRSPRRRGRRDGPEHRERLAARDPRRARGRGARCGLARPAHVGPVRDPERPSPDRIPPSPPPLSRRPAAPFRPVPRSRLGESPAWLGEGRGGPPMSAIRVRLAFLAVIVVVLAACGGAGGATSRPRRLGQGRLRRGRIRWPGEAR